MFYFVKTPWWLKKMYPQRLWNMDESLKSIYLTFDDGPHPEATPFVLAELKKYKATATFFCIGKNVDAHRSLFDQLLQEGHRTGNHTYSHMNGWHTDKQTYLNDIKKGAQKINSAFFRPPYGRIRSSQARELGAAMKIAEPKIVMWSVLSGDFDTMISNETCLKNVIDHGKSGSIIVFHDSQKAFSHLKYALPRVLEYFYEKGYDFRSL